MYFIYKDKQRRRSRKFKMTILGNLNYLAHDWSKLIWLGFCRTIAKQILKKRQKRQKKKQSKDRMFQQHVSIVSKGLFGNLLPMQDQCKADSRKKIERREKKTAKRQRETWKQFSAECFICLICPQESSLSSATIFHY